MSLQNIEKEQDRAAGVELVAFTDWQRDVIELTVKRSGAKIGRVTWSRRHGPGNYKLDSGQKHLTLADAVGSVLGINTSRAETLLREAELRN